MIPNSNNEFVYVPLPPRLLPAFYQWVLTMMEEPIEGKREGAPPLDMQRRNLNIIDLSIAAAHEIGANQHPVALADLHAAYLSANPGIGKGTTQDGFGA